MLKHSYYRRLSFVRAQAITPLECRIAVVMRRMYEHAHRGELSAATYDAVYRDPNCRRQDRDRPPGEGQRAALLGLLQLRGELGAEIFALLEAVVISEECWARIGHRVGCHAGTAKRWGIEALKMLVRVW